MPQVSLASRAEPCIIKPNAADAPQTGPQPKQPSVSTSDRSWRKANVSPVPVEPQQLRWFWQETFNRLSSLNRRVQEGKDLEAAREFCAYLLWSGVLEVFASITPEGISHVDWPHLRWKAEELQREVQERWRSGKNNPNIEVAELEAINRKLDLIAGHVSKLQRDGGESEWQPQSQASSNAA